MSSKPIHQWKVTELKEELKRRRLTTSGLKSDLVRRLDEALRAEMEASEKEKEVNGFEGHGDDGGVKDSVTFEAVEKENSGVVETIGAENAEKVLGAVVDDSGKNDKKDGVTDLVDNSASAVDRDVESTGLPVIVDSSNVGEDLITHASVVETTTITTVTESVWTEAVSGGEDSHNAEKNIEDSGTKLENEEIKVHSTDKNNDGSETKLENEESMVNSAEKNNEVLGTKLENEIKPRLESVTKPQYEDPVPNSSVPENQDTIITDNVKLEQDIVRPEMVEEPSSRNVPVYDESHSMDVGELHEKKPSVEENSNIVTSSSLNITNSSDYVGSPEKLNLDRSSGDDSMEEDLPESKQLDSKFNVNELRDKVEGTEVPTMKEENNTVVVGDGHSGGKSDANQDIDMSPLVPAEKRRLNEQASLESIEPAKRQRRWNTEVVKGPEPQITTPRSATTPKGEPVALKRNFSRSDSFASDDVPKERVVPPSQRPPTNSLRIDRFLRPFTLKAVQELLGKTGKVNSFWMDQIKTHCYVTYSSIEEATETRNAVYNLQWPLNGGRLLVAEYVEPEEVKLKIEPPPSQAPPFSGGPAIPPAPPSQPEPSPRQHQQLPPPPGTLPPPPPLSKAPPVARERLPSPPPLPEKVDPPIVTLDDLFRKTTATPRIYYLPLSEEQVAAKLAAQGKSSRQWA
ncbi:putative transcription regulator SAP family [Lupinus albus]|uniref:Putative transcription regulator SAP family n=1 Tax=Lupinus albus TaxID=3870 RepID=A0A6A4PTZ4_LUPAL|nr:putative transcription regulator SAP family [Lupinus albus]